VLIAIALPALALAGAPLTSGAVAKTALKSTVEFVPAPWPIVLKILLPVAAAGTSILMGRFIFLITRSMQKHGSAPRLALWLPWVALLIAVLLLTQLTATAAAVEKAGFFKLSALWPVLSGIALTWIFWQKKRSKTTGWQCPPGDLLEVFIWIGAKSKIADLHAGMLNFLSRIGQAASVSLRFLAGKLNDTIVLGIENLESRLRFWHIAGFCFVSIVSILFVVLQKVW
jgi:hypothetical protein